MGCGRDGVRTDDDGVLVLSAHKKTFPGRSGDLRYRKTGQPAGTALSTTTVAGEPLARRGAGRKSLRGSENFVSLAVTGKTGGYGWADVAHHRLRMYSDDGHGLDSAVN